MSKELVVRGLMILILGMAILYFLFSGVFSVHRLIGLIELTVGVMLFVFGFLFTVYVLIKRH